MCGGLALAVHANHHATPDIDIMIDSDFLTEAVAAVQELGFTIRAMPMKIKGVLSRYTD